MLQVKNTQSLCYRTATVVDGGGNEVALWY